jgi:hypothetical protein
VACPAVPYFSTLFTSGTIFQNIFEYKMCVLIFNTTLTHFSFYEKFSETKSYGCIGLHVKYPLHLPDFNETSTAPTDFEKILKSKTPCKTKGGSRVVPCGRTDRRTYMTKLIVIFRNFRRRVTTPPPPSKLPDMRRRPERDYSPWPQYSDDPSTVHGRERTSFREI